MRPIRTIDVQLEVRTCPSCKRTFKTAPTSPVIYDSYFCENLEKDHPRQTPSRCDRPESTQVQFTELEVVPKSKWRKKMPRLAFG